MTKKTKMIFGAIVILLIFTVVTVLALKTGYKRPAILENSETISSQQSNLTVEIPTVSQSSSQPYVQNLNVELNTTSQPSSSTSSKTPATNTAKPVITSTPSNSNSSSTIKIGDGGPTEPQDYIVDGRKFRNAENYSYWQNWMLKGCDYCGSHDCVAFFSVDAFGYTSYNWRNCPQYDIKKDPAIYCQICGKKGGDGRNDTCARYINGTNCPYCGVWVESRTCHTCAN